MIAFYKAYFDDLFDVKNTIDKIKLLYYNIFRLYDIIYTNYIIIGGKLCSM